MRLFPKRSQIAMQSIANRMPMAPPASSPSPVQNPRVSNHKAAYKCPKGFDLVMISENGGIKAYCVRQIDEDSWEIRSPARNDVNGQSPIIRDRAGNPVPTLLSCPWEGYVLECEGGEAADQPLICHCVKRDAQGQIVDIKNPVAKPVVKQGKQVRAVDTGDDAAQSGPQTNPFWGGWTYPYYWQPWYWGWGYPSFGWGGWPSWGGGGWGGWGGGWGGWGGGYWGNPQENPAADDNPFWWGGYPYYWWGNYWYPWYWYPWSYGYFPSFFFGFPHFRFRFRHGHQPQPQPQPQPGVGAGAGGGGLSAVMGNPQFAENPQQNPSGEWQAVSPPFFKNGSRVMRYQNVKTGEIREGNY